MDYDKQIKTLYIFRGVPGSGKSTAGKSVVDLARRAGLTAEQFEADSFFNDVEGKYNFDIKKLSLAHADCFCRFCRAVDGEVNIITLTNTSTRPWEFEKYQAYAEEHRYMVMIFVTEHRHQNVDVHQILPGVREKMIKNLQSRGSIKLW